MRMKHKHIDIPAENPFKNCKLDRAKYANILTSLIKTADEGFVLSVNNEWGTGKTTFIKMWQAKLENNEGYKTLYFNAWENDYEKDAMVAIMAELHKLKGTDAAIESVFKSVMEKGAVLARSALPLLLKGIIEKHVGKDSFKELLGALAEGTSELFSGQIEEYSKKTENLKEFKESIDCNTCRTFL